MHRFLKRSRVEHQQEVSSVSGEVILSLRGDATSICPITGQPSLAPISVTRSAIGACVDIFDECRQTFEYVFGKMRVEAEEALAFVKGMAKLAEKKAKAGEAKPAGKATEKPSQ